MPTSSSLLRKAINANNPNGLAALVNPLRERADFTDNRHDAEYLWGI